MRPSEPQAVREWRELCQRPPKCCHTCDHYSCTGNCTKFKRIPPDEFAAKLGACDQWEQEIPVPF